MFNFKDDDLGTKTKGQRAWIEEFADEIEHRGFSRDILWRISCRVDEVDSELLARLAEVGLQTVYLGIESGSDEGLRTANKHYHVDDVYRAVDTLRALDMDYEYGFMLFDPYSTFQTIRDNIRLLEYVGRGGRTVVRFTKMFPYVGTSIEERLKAEGRLKGTIANPEYDYLDRRLNLLEVVISQSFHDLIFGSDGLGKQLENAHFDIKILKKFFPGRYDVAAYEQSVREVTDLCNGSALETMGKAVDYIESRMHDEILESWWLLELLKSQERSYQEHLKERLHRLSLTPLAYLAQA